MTTTYYRIHDTDRCSPEDLLRSEHQVSRVWIDACYRRCAECAGHGTDEDGRTCRICGGEGQERVEEQQGVSACRSLRDLRSYMAERSPYTAGCVVIEMEAEECEELDVDHRAGAVLVRPTRIVRVLPVEEAL